MIGITIQLKNFRELGNGLRQFQEDAKSAINATTALIQTRTATNLISGGHVVTGNLLNNIRTSPARNSGGGIVGTVFMKGSGDGFSDTGSYGVVGKGGFITKPGNRNTAYAWVQNYGHATQYVTPTRGKYLVGNVNGKWFKSKMVRGIRNPSQFFTKAILESKPDFIALIQATLKADIPFIKITGINQRGFEPI